MRFPLKNSQGFSAALMTPFIALSVSVFTGFFLLSLSVKNITRAESACVRAAMQAQERLARQLKKLLMLNKMSRLLNTQRKAAEFKAQAALTLLQMHIYAQAQLKIQMIKMAQKKLIQKQKGIIRQARQVKIQARARLKRDLQPLAVKSAFEETASQDPLAVQRISIGKDAFVYQPAPQFSKKQTIRFVYRMNPFGLKFSASNASLAAPFSVFSGVSFQYHGKYHCAATLKARGGGREPALVP